MLYFAANSTVCETKLCLELLRGCECWVAWLKTNLKGEAFDKLERYVYKQVYIIKMAAQIRSSFKNIEYEAYKLNARADEHADDSGNR
jgi:hypothetical protein